MLTRGRGSRARIEGDLVHRAALHGVLALVHTLGLGLLEVQRVASRHRS